MNYWLVKSEPKKYSWEQFAIDPKTVWDGVRNYQASKNLKDMKLNDSVLFYHSNEGKMVMGIARVVKEFYPDPTAVLGDWVAVDLAFKERLSHSVSLAAIKACDVFQDIALVKQPRLSVMPLSEAAFNHIVSMGS